MLFENKKCEVCQYEYDKTLLVCPHCQKENDSRKNYVKSFNILYLPIFKEIFLLIIGTFGLFIFQFIVAIIFKFIPNLNDLTFNSLTTFTSYLLTFVALFALIFVDIYNIVPFFKKIKPYIFGIICGIIIILINYSYSALISLAYPSFNDNENQKIATNLVLTFPFASAVTLIFIGPICEEFTYRVGLFSFLTRVNKTLAFILTSLIFGIIHCNFFSSDIINELLNLPIYILDGLLLCATYYKFKISGSITAHALNNLFSFIMVFIGNK